MEGELSASALYATPEGEAGEGPSAPSAGDLREMIRSVIRDDPTLLSASAGHTPSTLAGTASGKSVGV